MAKYPRQLEVQKIDDKILIVYNWDDLSEVSLPRIWKNVECFDISGKKLWTVNGMENYKYWNKDTEFFVGLRNKLGKIQLTDFSGNSYDLDLETGKVTHYEFHK